MKSLFLKGLNTLKFGILSKQLCDELTNYGIMSDEHVEMVAMGNRSCEELYNNNQECYLSIKIFLNVFCWTFEWRLLSINYNFKELITIISIFDTANLGILILYPQSIESFYFSSYPNMLSVNLRGSISPIFLCTFQYLWFKMILWNHFDHTK